MNGPFFYTLVLLAALLAAAFYQVVIHRRKITTVIRQSRQLSDLMEERARSSEGEKKRVLAILESLAEGVIVTDKSGQVTLLNTALASLLGVDRVETEGRYFWEIFRDPEINKTLQAALNDQLAVKKEHTMLLSDRSYQIHVSPVFSNQNFIGAAAVFYDLTKIKELERARQEFVANVSHELKTPLTSIIGFVETLKEGAIEDAENRVKFLQIIDEHSHKLRALIEDLLLLSKLESDEDRVKMERLDLEKILRKISNLFEQNLDAKKITLETELRPRPFIILGDGLLIEQALTNLLDNAIKYNRPEGKISVHGTQGPHETTIRVEDSGVGIPASDLPRIFERFYRVEKSRARETGGTGLGLSIVKHIVEKHRGTIEVNSAEDKGTSFTITLPSL